jgi:phosphoadenosine phosphosulfate reductase
MRHERVAEFATEPVDRLDALRLTFGGASARDVLAGVIAEFPDQVAVVSSFGADAAVLLHMVSEVDRDTPVLLVDTLMLFEETLEYQRDLSAALGLRNVRHVRAEVRDLSALDPDDDLHLRDPDACCVIRKVAPLDRALRRYPVCVSGRKRFQSSSRAALETFEVDRGRLRVSPLSRWSAADLADYMDAHSLPRHPLVARGYPSIGCAPCTSRVAEGEDVRAGRWRGTGKVECGIHFTADGVARSNAMKGAVS